MWPVAIALTIASTFVTRRNKNRYRFLDRRLWLTEWTLDVGAMMFMPGWWKIMGLVFIIPSTAGLMNPWRFHQKTRKLMYRKLVRQIIECYHFDGKEPDAILERAIWFLEHYDFDKDE